MTVRKHGNSKFGKKEGCSRGKRHLSIKKKAKDVGSLEVFWVLHHV